jgi:hypothetical protein
MTGVATAMTDDGIRPTEEQRRRQRGRSIAIAIALAGLVVLFYLVTIVKLGPGVVDRPL